MAILTGVHPAHVGTPHDTPARAERTREASTADRLANQEKWKAIEAVAVDFPDNVPPPFESPEIEVPYGFVLPFPLVWGDLTLPMRRQLLEAQAAKPSTFKYTVLSRDALFMIRGMRWTLLLMRDFGDTFATEVHGGVDQGSLPL